MIYIKTWSKGYGSNRDDYFGVFLLGFIPIYIVRKDR